MGTGLVFEGALHPRRTEHVLLQNENGDWESNPFINKF